MFHIKHFLKSLQHHNAITKHSATSEIKKYRVNGEFVVIYDFNLIVEISYDRTMPEFLWILSNNGWQQLTIAALHYRNFVVYQKSDIF
jgi:hypothetical protein